MTNNRVITGAIAALVAALFVLPFRINPMWSIELSLIGLAFGATSPVIASRRLYYLAAVAPHSAFLAASVVPLALALSGLYLGYGALYTLIALVGSIPIALSVLAISRGSSSDLVATLLVAGAASVAILAQFAANMEGAGMPLSTLIAGDPLFLTPKEAALTSIVALASLAASISVYWYHLYTGIYPEGSLLYPSKLRRALGEAGLVVSVAASTTGLVLATGFILQHALLLLPSIIASRISRSASEAMRTSILVSLASSLAGLNIALALDLPPSGVIALILLMLALLASVSRD